MNHLSFVPLSATHGRAQVHQPRTNTFSSNSQAATFNLSSASHLDTGAHAGIFALLAGVVFGLKGVRRGKRAFRGARISRCAAEDIWVAGLQDEREFRSEQEYVKHVESKAELPEGFRVGTAGLTFVSHEAEGMGNLPMKLTMICLDQPTDKYAAVFTTNAFPGAPVLVGRRRLQEGAPLQAVIVNNKVSNVFPGNGGEQASETVCEAAAEALGLEGGAQSVLPSSTGVIGWRLPVKEMVAAMPEVVKNLQSKSVYPAAEGICTTDRYAKVSSATLPNGARIVGIAKGAGMIEPNMATMLSYILTDADLRCSRAELQAALAEAVKSSFNAISIDGDESTSDTVALLSSCRGPQTEVSDFTKVLTDVCRDLASQVVRNGEGTQHVIRVSVSGADSDATAEHIGHAVVNGPLFKSAVAGNDPNVGRLVAKVGQALGTAGVSMASGCTCRIGGEVIFEGGRFTLDTAKEARLVSHLQGAFQDDLKYPPHHRVVDVEVRLGGNGVGTATVLGSDLTKQYVEINGDYRS